MKCTPTEMRFKMFVCGCKNRTDNNWCYNTDHVCCAEHCPKVKDFGQKMKEQEKKKAFVERMTKKKM